MCLSIAINRPDDVLANGEHLGFEWMIIHNRIGYRCGYVKVPPGHPWHGKYSSDLDADVHGGLTFAEADVPCDAGGQDNGHWLGFDCAHSCDMPDATLPMDGDGCAYHDTMNRIFDLYKGDYSAGVRTQEYVEGECRKLCEQAHAATAGNP